MTHNQRIQKRYSLLLLGLLTIFLAASCGKTSDTDETPGPTEQNPAEKKETPCKDDRGCPGERCDEERKVCVSLVETGGKCDKDAECLGGSCLKDSRWSDGYCSQEGCSTASDCRTGKKSLVKVACMASVVPENDGYCVRTCSRDKDCGRENFECNFNDGDGVGYCLEKEGAGAVSPVFAQDVDKQCVQASNYVKTTEPGTKPYQWEVELPFELPEGVKGFTLRAMMSGGFDPKARLLPLLPLKITNSAGEVLKYFFYAPGIGPSAVWGNVQLQIPLSPKDKDFLKPGELKVKYLAITKDAEFCVTPHVTTEVGDELDINLYVVGVDGSNGERLTPENIKNDEGISKMIESVRDIYGQEIKDKDGNVLEKLKVGKVRYIFPSEEFVQKYQILRPDFVEYPDWQSAPSLALMGVMIRELVRHSRPPTDNPDDLFSINVFLVRSFSNAIGGGFVLGVSSGIPGLAGIHGTKASGAVFSAEGLSRSGRDIFDPDKEVTGAQLLGSTMAHEMGHFMGLFHTTDVLEYPNGAYADKIPKDPLEDTPFCRKELVEKISQNPNFSFAFLLECEDVRNIMFYHAVSLASYELTADQAFVLRHSPLFHKSK